MQEFSIFHLSQRHWDASDLKVKTNGRWSVFSNLKTNERLNSPKSEYPSPNVFYRRKTREEIEKEQQKRFEQEKIDGQKYSNFSSFLIKDNPLLLPPNDNYKEFRARKEIKSIRNDDDPSISEFSGNYQYFYSRNSKRFEFERTPRIPRKTATLTRDLQVSSLNSARNRRFDPTYTLNTPRSEVDDSYSFHNEILNEEEEDIQTTHEISLDQIETDQNEPDPHEEKVNQSNGNETQSSPCSITPNDDIITNETTEDQNEIAPQKDEYTKIIFRQSSETQVNNDNPEKNDANSTEYELQDQKHIDSTENNVKDDIKESSIDAQNHEKYPEDDSFLIDERNTNNDSHVNDNLTKFKNKKVKHKKLNKTQVINIKKKEIQSKQAYYTINPKMKQSDINNGITDETQNEIHTTKNFGVYGSNYNDYNYYAYVISHNLAVGDLDSNFKYGCSNKNHKTAINSPLPSTRRPATPNRDRYVERPEKISPEKIFKGDDPLPARRFFLSKQAKDQMRREEELNFIAMAKVKADLRKTVVVSRNQPSLYERSLTPQKPKYRWPRDFSHFSVD